jgi:hypothetical protein
VRVSACREHVCGCSGERLTEAHAHSLACRQLHRAAAGGLWEAGSAHITAVYAVTASY